MYHDQNDADWEDEVPVQEKKVRKNKSPEFEEQCKVARYLREKDYLHTCSLAGLQLPMGSLLKAKRAGYTKGTPDVLVLERRGIYGGLFIEMKPEKSGRVSDDQLAWGAKAWKRGYKAIVCHGAAEAIRAIETYMEGRYE